MAQEEATANAKGPMVVHDLVEWYRTNCKIDMVCDDNKLSDDGHFYPTTCHKCNSWSEYGKIAMETGTAATIKVDSVAWYREHCKADMVCTENKLAEDGHNFPTTCHKCHSWSEFGKQ